MLFLKQFALIKDNTYFNSVVSCLLYYYEEKNKGQHQCKKYGVKIQ